MVPTMLFTPMGTVPKARQRYFLGFVEEDRSVEEAVMRRRIITLETEMKEMKDRFDKMEKMVETLITKKGVWKSAYDGLHKKLTLYEEKAMEYKGKVEELNVKQENWKKEQEEEKIDFRKIVEEQTKANDTKLTEKVVQVIKQKENLVRETEDKKKTCGIQSEGRVYTSVD